jgi:hypothetical protein
MIHTQREREREGEKERERERENILPCHPLEKQKHI